MTSRRSMLQGIAAACVGGWWGLGRKAAGAAIEAGSPESAPSIGLQYESGYGPHRGGFVYGYSHVEYDADGQVVYGSRSEGQSFYYL